MSDRPKVLRDRMTASPGIPFSSRSSGIVICSSTSSAAWPSVLRHDLSGGVGDVRVGLDRERRPRVVTEDRHHQNTATTSHRRWRHAATKRAITGEEPRSSPRSASPVRGPSSQRSCPPPARRPRRCAARTSTAQPRRRHRSSPPRSPLRRREPTVSGDGLLRNVTVANMPGLSRKSSFLNETRTLIVRVSGSSRSPTKRTSTGERSRPGRRRTWRRASSPGERVVCPSPGRLR